MQIFAVHIFHGNIRQAFYLANVVDAAYVGVRDLARDANLGVKSGQCLRVGRSFFWQEFEGYRLAEAQVRGAINFAHSSGAQQTDNAIAAAQQRAWKESALFG